MNNEFDTEESINSDEAVKVIECKQIIPNFQHDPDNMGTSVYKRMTKINPIIYKFKDVLICKDDMFTQSSPFKSTNFVSSGHVPNQTDCVDTLIYNQESSKEVKIHLADSRRRNTPSSVERLQQNPFLQKKTHRISQPNVQTNLIQERKPRRQIYVTQIVNDHSHQDLNSFPFPRTQKLSRIIANDGLQSQRESQASTPRGILKSCSSEAIRIGSRLSMQSLNSPMRPTNKNVSFEFTSEQIRKLKNRSRQESGKYQRLKTRFNK